MENLIIDDLEFRIRKLNSIELFSAIQNMDTSNYYTSKATYELMLTFVEVKVKDTWLQVKQGDEYYPAKILDDMSLLKDVLDYVYKYLKSVFQKSNE